MKTASFHISALACTLIILASSCKHREVCYDHTHMLDVNVNYDWTYAPDALPASMVTRLFPIDGQTEPQRHETIEKDNAIIRVQAGRYIAIGLNGSTETLIETGDSYDEFVITTEEDELLSPMSKAPSSAPRPEEAKDEPIRKSPDALWYGCNENVSLVPLKSNQRIDLTMHKSTIECTIELRNVENANSPIEISGALSGLSGAFSPSTAKPTTECVTMPVSLKVIDSHTIAGTITIFGHCHDKKNRHIFSIYTSNRYFYHFDVTDMMHANDDSNHITIIIDDALRLPDPQGTGMTPSIIDWSDEIHIDLDM
ncbi:MAG: DUF5119 domain-containing protein [Muribaculaceae bacterium]|nr:DUF5119 domain-containing protein [Muribaculaceae bacterium]